MQQFLDAHSGVVGPVNQAEARKQLDAAVARLRVVVDEQGVRIREAAGEYANRRRLEEVLYKKFVGPAARSLVLAPAPHQAKYIAAKFSADFFAQLAKGADAVDASLKLTAESDRTRAGATKAIRDALQQGRAAIETMHSLVSYLILGNVQLEAEWRAARRVRLDTGVRRQRSETLITSTAGSAPAPVVVSEEVKARAA